MSKCSYLPVAWVLCEFPNHVQDCNVCASERTRPSSPLSPSPFCKAEGPGGGRRRHKSFAQFSSAGQVRGDAPTKGVDQIAFSVNKTLFLYCLGHIHAPAELNRKIGGGGQRCVRGPAAISPGPDPSCSLSPTVFVMGNTRAKKELLSCNIARVSGLPFVHWRQQPQLTGWNSFSLWHWKRSTHPPFHPQPPEQKPLKEKGGVSDCLLTQFLSWLFVSARDPSS